MILPGMAEPVKSSGLDSNPTHIGSISELVKDNANGLIFRNAAQLAGQLEVCRFQLWGVRLS
jgi:hypothetical protein